VLKVSLSFPATEESVVVRDASMSDISPLLRRLDPPSPKPSKRPIISMSSLSLSLSSRRLSLGNRYMMGGAFERENGREFEMPFFFSSMCEIHFA